MGSCILFYLFFNFLNGRSGVLSILWLVKAFHCSEIPMIYFSFTGFLCSFLRKRKIFPWNIVKMFVCSTVIFNIGCAKSCKITCENALLSASLPCASFRISCFK
ncbi:hypothetical protein DM860_008429 [Cuscuta australis]|uniref:Uncharacterized protein n=1 Tax=Cuscuta australis TaxID=267555 RepID=A0A328D8U9_9ASTE|nr:hypothetical protein DM860_008429 [Cuscuta australis]